MNIQWYGGGCFIIKGKRASIYINPTERSFRSASLKDNIVLSTLVKVDEFKKSFNDQEILFIDQPGEYEKAGIFIYGLPVYNDKNYQMIYRIEMEDLNLVYLGNLNEKLSEEILEEFDGVNILILPVGGDSVLEPKRAANLASQIDATVIIPCYYKTDDDKKSKFESIDKFLKESGYSSHKEISFTPKSKDFEGEESQVIILDKN
ncbi:MAG: MBL fold metallo-hydrolase [Patescibacteria group bacterium]|jgi:hypothetical protein|nr:MBL fold metallo-hydrolase [Patescibacteria group bacterium]